MTLTPGSKLGPYEIIALIGAGGMGEVWKARDTRLGRVVAIKTVKEQHSERFKQEARSIAALNHPNICQLFDIGPDYLVLEYVEGKPLLGSLPEKETVRLAIQIAAALEEAHRNGIIHRDLKPSNIMVTDKGSVKLLDFGLAKLYAQDAGSAGLPGVALAKLGVPPAISTSPTADYPATQVGTILGTVAYMSPEQAQGQPADVPSDIFSFGLVLYEMLSGRRAFSGDSTPTVMAALLRDDPLPLQASSSLEKIVRRCLAKQPSGRYQTISEAKAALELVFAEKVTTGSPEPPSIAVLPFVNMSGDKEQEYFSDGLAEEIINALTQIPGLKVISRTSSFAFRGKEQDITRIAEALRVNTILEGSVRKAGNRIRVTAQLINASDGSHLWSERYDRDITDVFAIQDEIAQAIASKLRMRLSGEGPRVKRYTENVEAYNLCLRGRHHLLKITEEGLAKGKDYYEQAIALDPNCALALAGLASFYQLMGTLGSMPLTEAHSHFHQTITKALSIDETLPDIHVTLAIHRARSYDWKSAEREFNRALELAPESTEAWRLYAFYYLVPMRRLDEAIALMKKALERDPLLPVLQWSLGATYFFARQWDQVFAHCRKALDVDPHYWLSHMYSGFGHIQTGKPDEGIQACEAAANIVKRNSYALGCLGWAYARVGRIDKANQLLEELKELAQRSYMLPSAMANVYAGLGEIHKAFDWMEKAIDDCDGGIIHSHLSPLYDAIRPHPRYQTLLRKMNLEP